ncbi:restriction endonuclease subunit S [Oceanithermus sp.]
MIQKLKPYPAYKDSGVEWLGEVPEGWEVKKLRQVTRLIVSNVDKKSSNSEVPVRLCNYMDVYNHEVITEDLSFMQATATKEEIRKFAVKRGDVVITKDSEIWNDIGVPAYVNCEAPNLIYGYHLAILRPLANTLEGKYLFRTLQSQPVATQLHIEATGVTRFGLSQQAIKSVQIPLPPLPEQRAIAEYLDRETKKIDAAIEKTKKSIELWEELRATLIADVVTGKLDVRKAAEGLPEEEPGLKAKIEAFEASLQANEAGVDEGAAEGEEVTLEETA